MATFFSISNGKILSIVQFNFPDLGVSQQHFYFMGRTDMIVETEEGESKKS